jgi:Fe-S oxidoreductase
MEIRTIAFIIVLIVAIAFLAKNLSRLYSYLKIAKPDNRFDNPMRRLKHTLVVAFAQTKILRDKQAGLLHVAIFWGFLVLLFSASASIVQGFYHDFSWSFLGPVYSIISFMTDLFSVLIIIAIIVSFLRRYVIKVKRLQIADPEESRDAMIVLLTIFTIVVSLFIENAAAQVMGKASSWAVCPFSTILSNIISVGAAPIVYEIFWWIHIIAILGFMNYLPFSKHLHVYTSIPNVYFSSTEPVNSLEPIDFEDESIEKYGVIDIDDLTWKNLFDGYTCTHCGRCTSVCPANTTGKILDPREVIIQIRERTMEAAPIMLKQKINGDAENEEPNISEDEQKVLDKKFVGEYESIEAMWQCTTCGACMQECPVMIEHVPAIIGMRRNLVMMEADFPSLLQSAFTNLENNGSPWAFSQAERADWAEGTGVRTAAENPDFEVLFWVGCAGSFDDRAKEISKAFSKLLQIAGVNFAILGTEEQCNGDPARRSGNEYLADMLVKTNIETMESYNVKKIVTICPHCFNTFKNDYPKFGAKYEVIHHTEFLLDLLKNGKIKLKGDENHRMNIVYHDSCYLGRYNGMYKQPRAALESIPGVKLIEPDRTGDKGFCCGAGGGQMFMEETEGKRVNIERTEELLESGAKTIALNCPFCMTMITDGVKAEDKVEEVRVKDVAELLLEFVDMPEEKVS